MILAVTVDTEADNQWDFGTPVTTRNVAYLAPFQELCQRHAVKPTYLVASEIVHDDRARNLLTSWSREGNAEIGAHLHAWTTPPFDERPGMRYNDPVHAFASQLPGELLRSKTENLTQEIVAAFGVRPTSFRSGRFGMDTRTASLLDRAGYIVDSSVTPLTSWSHHPGLDGIGGPDFRRHTATPFRIAGSGDPGLLEIPVTIVCTYTMLRRFPLLLKVYQSLPFGAARRLSPPRLLRAQPMRLTPQPGFTAKELAEVWCCAEGSGLNVAVMIIHSSELMPGGSPFRPDASSIRDLYSCLDAFFAFAIDHGAVPAGLTDAAAIVAGNPALGVKAL